MRSNRLSYPAIAKARAKVIIIFFPAKKNRRILIFLFAQCENRIETKKQMESNPIPSAFLLFYILYYTFSKFVFSLPKNDFYISIVIGLYLFGNILIITICDNEKITIAVVIF